MSVTAPSRARSPWLGRGGDAPFRCGFLLVPNFTLIGFGSAVDPLRLANMVAERPLYEFVVLSEDGQAVRSSDGIRVLPDHSIEAAPPLDALLLIGPNPIPDSGIEFLLRWLRRLAANGVALGGVDTGSYFLARAGLLDGYRCTIHWEDMDALVDRFPRLIVSNKLFEVDRDRCSCSGGIAPVEMMIHLIALGAGGRRLAVAVSELLICDQRGPEEKQRIPLRGLLGPGHPKLVEAVTLMECNLEEPLSMEEVAGNVELSARQLERLFREHLAMTPSQYYLQLRLERAHQLLTRTSRPLSDIAMASGFVSLAHFSHRYSAAYGVSPGADRRRRGAPPAAGKPSER